MGAGNPNLPKTAARLVASALAQCAPGQREEMLAHLWAHTGAAMQIIVGREATAEAAYRMADALATAKESA